MAATSQSRGITRAIVDACRPFPVTVAYLFGSHACGIADDESDVDIAVLVEASLTPQERGRLKLKLLRRLAESLPIDAIDVVLLQDVPVLLQYNVIRHGDPVFVR